MLGLMQLIQYMSVTLEYTDLEIDDAFTAIVNGDETIETLCDVLGVDLNPTILVAAQAKVSKWKSAAAVIKMKQAA